MDAFTLMVSCMLLGTVMAASMGLLYLAGVRQRCLLDWSVAGAAFAGNNICGILGRAFARCRRGGVPLHVIIFDIDHFKSINDRHGHAVGHAAIRHVTATAAQAVADRVRAQVAAHGLAMENGALAMTVSVGLATLRAQDAGWDDVLQRADAALYQAKRHGRNRVAAADHFIQTA